MDKYGQISDSTLDDAFEALNWLSELVWKELIEDYISQKLDPGVAQILWKNSEYTGLYGSGNWWISQLIEYWKNWLLIHLSKSTPFGGGPTSALPL
jgi:hypothetical protein